MSLTLGEKSSLCEDLTLMAGVQSSHKQNSGTLGCGGQG